MVDGNSNMNVIPLEMEDMNGFVIQQINKYSIHKEKRASLLWIIETASCLFELKQEKKYCRHNQIITSFHEYPLNHISKLIHINIINHLSYKQNLKYLVHVLFTLQ